MKSLALETFYASHLPSQLQCYELYTLHAHRARAQVVFLLVRPQGRIQGKISNTLIHSFFAI